MAGFDAAESLTPFQFGREGRAAGYGAILFDSARVRQVEADWFTPGHWAERARPVDSGGRGGAWFIDGPFGAAVLRRYLRGGWAASVSRDGYWWRGSTRVRSFLEFRLTSALHARGLPVPRPLAACYWRRGASGAIYHAAILVERLNGVHSLAERAAVAGDSAPWEETGRLVARFHRAGLDHADLNAHNLLFDATGHGWMIDFDRCRMHIPATGWRERNLARLLRSLLKGRGARAAEAVLRDFARLRASYDATWQRGY